MMSPLHHNELFRDLDVFLVESLVRTFCGDKAPNEDVQTLLTLASRTISDGHICLNLSDLNGLTTPIANAENLLRACPELVGDGSGLQPFVLDCGRLFLRRFWVYEKSIADRLLNMVRQPLSEISADLEKKIDGLTVRHGEKSMPLAKAQREAIRTGLRRQLVIITGGPGTGKTTIVAQLLKMLDLQNGQEGHLRVRLAAPTGKAAARLGESVRQGIGADSTHLDLTPASTMERLLGYLSNSPYFVYNRKNRLPADVVVMDEASMIDLPKMAKLLEALNDHTRLILLGDKNQLASVEPGSVMAELCDSANLKESVVELTESQRFDENSAVTPLAKAVNEERADDAWRIATDGIAGVPGQKVIVHDSSAFNYGPPPPDFAQLVRERYQPFKDAQTPADAFAALSRFRVLCALQREPIGAKNINAVIEDILFPHRRGEFYDHRSILVTKNDYEIKLFNGDVGIVLPDPARNGNLAVFFEDRATSVPCNLLHEHETAFAMTIHKVQGSGFGHVAVLLPDRSSLVMTRELLYTALTRTETGVDLWCTEEFFKEGVRRHTLRTMGLRNRLDAEPLAENKE